MRAPSFMAIQALPTAVQGGLIADVVAVIGSTDVVMGDCYRWAFIPRWSTRRPGSTGPSASWPTEGAPFAYTPENQVKFDEKSRATRRSAEVGDSLCALSAQGQQGYLTGNAMRFVAEQIGWFAGGRRGRLSYYTMFYTKPVGKRVLNVCRTLSCALLGAERVTEELSKKRHHAGRDDARWRVHAGRSGVPGRGDRAPVVMVNDDWHERLAPEKAVEFIDDLRRAVRPRSPGAI